ncbi:hypothetical protein HQ945_08375 [Phyllobacterium sp. BT25]|uniref:Uncharacterized protein n=1 Tax=Phyllobacterium pellucidum TaxID=2740464 RepID=A0A849VRH0_9HYPH|nr:hypothetical protein [Phyllobacterium pellucidum]NTS31269.1 hypothetical protein [Phyllobacterium pellucidum]
MFTVKAKRIRHMTLSAQGLSGPSKVKVGLPKGAADGEIIKIGVWNHFGTKGGASGGGWGGPIPERPFLTNAMRNNRSNYRSAMRSAAKAVLLGSTNMKSVVTKLGIMGQGDVQKEITALRSPPNSPVTIALKGSDNPLIDTGRLRASITYKVDD